VNFDFQPDAGNHGKGGDRLLAGIPCSRARVGAEANFPMLCGLAIAGNSAIPRHPLCIAAAPSRFFAEQPLAASKQGARLGQ